MSHTATSSRSANRVSRLPDIVQKCDSFIFPSDYNQLARVRRCHRKSRSLATPPHKKAYAKIGFVSEWLVVALQEEGCPGRAITLQREARPAPLPPHSEDGRIPNNHRIYCTGVAAAVPSVVCMRADNPSEGCGRGGPETNLPHTRPITSIDRPHLRQWICQPAMIDREPSSRNILVVSLLPIS